MKPAITVVVLAEEVNKNLQRAIYSVKSAHRILIIDTSRKLDQSKLKFPNVEILEYTKPSLNFSAIRNYAIRRVTTDWIMFLDSDEQLEAGGLEKLHSIISSHPNSPVSLLRSDVFLGKILHFGEAGRQRITRVFRKNRVKYHGAVHEFPIVTGCVVKSNIHIFHTSHDSIFSFIVKINKYAQLVAKTDNSSFLKENALVTWFKLVFYPSLKFLYNYFLKQGVRDGWRGLVYASTMSLHSLLVRIYQLEMRYEKNN